MKSRKRHSARRASACADELHADDGAAAADELFRRTLNHYDHKEDRKTLQLCGQVRRALALAFAGDLADPVLQDGEVAAVTPAPDATRLLVSVRPPTGAAPDDVLRRLGRVRGLLRHAAAQAVVRKRAPELVFRVIGARAEVDQ